MRVSQLLYRGQPSKEPSDWDYRDAPSPRTKPTAFFWHRPSLIAAFTLVCLIISIPTLISTWKFISKGSIIESNGGRTLSFDVCHGMSNQRLSLLYGVMLATELGRSPVIPEFILSGQISSGSEVEAPSSVPMEIFYDVDFFVDMMASVGVRVLRYSQAPSFLIRTPANITSMANPIVELGMLEDKRHLSIGCPLFRVSRFSLGGANSRIVQAVLRGMKPERKLLQSADAIVKRLRAESSSGTFNFLHLRVERDWLNHCQRLEFNKKEQQIDNCMNNTDSVDEVLDSLRLKHSDPLYVASFWEQVEPEVERHIIGRLNHAGYNVFTMKDLLSSVPSEKEFNAIVDFEISLHALKMVGNSVSSFTALSMFQRRLDDKWASYYNGGDVPMSVFLPMNHLPWVFTYSSGNRDWDYMVKAALRSALRYQSVKPFCIWSGNASTSMYAWLVENGVTMISHNTTWIDDLWKKASESKVSHVKRFSFYSSKEALLNDFIRMDLPVIPELEQYIYVLFTEPDIFFLKKVTVANFKLPPSTVFGMAEEPASSSGVDGGVMLVNLPAARVSYQPFKVFILGHENGPFFFAGPGIVGAYLEFYGNQVKKDTISNKYAVKPFKPYDSSGSIVHFQGPKPHEYWQYFMTRTCPRGQTQCQDAFAYGLCFYMKIWQHLVNESEYDVGISLWTACVATYSSHVTEMCSLMSKQ